MSRRNSQAITPSAHPPTNPNDRRVSRLSSGILGALVEPKGKGKSPSVSPKTSPFNSARRTITNGGSKTSPLDRRTSTIPKKARSIVDAATALRRFKRSGESEKSGDGLELLRQSFGEKMEMEHEMEIDMEKIAILPPKTNNYIAKANDSNNNVIENQSGSSSSNININININSNSSPSPRRVKLKDVAQSAMEDILREEANAMDDIPKHDFSADFDLSYGNTNTSSPTPPPKVHRKLITGESYTFHDISKRVSNNDEDLISFAVRSTGQNFLSISVQGGENVTLVLPLHLTGAKIDDFSAALINNTVLQKIDFRGNDLTDDNIIILMKGLKNSTSLTSLNLSNNNVTVNSMAALSKIVATSLVTLNLSYNMIGDSGAQKLATAISNPNTMLRDLFLDTAAIKHYGASFLAAAFAVNRSLENINLSGNLISQSCKRIAFAIMRNVKLKNVQLGDAHLESIGAEHFSRFMESSTSLTSIDLFGNGITDSGCFAIANALTVNRSIKRICLKRNNIGDEGIGAISSSLVANGCLESLDVGGNYFGDVGLKRLGTVLTISGALKELDVSDSKLTSASLTTMSDVLRTNDKLVVLNMSENKIGSVELQGLNHALEVNDSLEVLYLSADGLGQDGLDELMQLENFWDSRIICI